MKQANKTQGDGEMSGNEETTFMDDAEDEQPFNEIDQLQQHGINMADINKLKQAGLTTVLSVLMW